ncbi:MAG: NAD-dependent epimerase/dehydratase family protein [Zoogloea sp.]|nr:NAD-dependent epimerase/dehydratase family protein [Zoogloea sp.]
MKVLLTGASGFVGRNVAMALAAQGHTVRPVSRRHGIDVSRMRSPADWLPCLNGVDAAVNAVGIIGETPSQRFDQLHAQAPVALFRACEQAGVRRVVQISALGTDETAFSAYHLSKRIADEALVRLDLDGVVLRPSLIYGRGGTSAELFLRVAGLPLIPVLESGQQLLQPVHISDVVATVLRALEEPPPRQALDIVGPERVTYAEWMQTLRAAQGRSRGRMLRLPFGAAMVLCRLGQRLHPLAAPDNLRMLRKGYLACDQAIRQFLGRPLLRAEPHLQFADASILWSQR